MNSILFLSRRVSRNLKLANDIESVEKLARWQMNLKLFGRWPDMAFEGETVIMIAGWRMPQECLWDYFPMASLSFCSPSTCASMVT